MALNRELLGREYRQAENHILRPEQIHRHRNAICAQSFAPLPSREAHVPASLSFHICQGALTSVLLDGDLGLDSMRLVFAGLDVSYLHDIELDRQTTASAVVKEITSTTEGESLTLDLQLRQAATDPCMQARIDFLERNPRPKPNDEAQLSESPHPNSDELQIDFVHELPLRKDALMEMLDVLGEFNPIYRDEELAQLANLPAPCLPPSYIFAMAHHAVEQALGDTPHRIKRISGRFARAPWVGDTLTVRVGAKNGRAGFIEIRDSAARKVFADGLFEAGIDESNPDG